MLKCEHITCDICAGLFDSNNKNCKRCEFYDEGFSKYGRTKSNLDCQIEAGIISLKCIINQI